MDVLVFILVDADFLIPHLLHQIIHAPISIPPPLIRGPRPRHPLQRTRLIMTNARGIKVDRIQTSNAHFCDIGGYLERVVVLIEEVEGVGVEARY